MPASSTCRLGQIDALGLDATDRVVQFASPSFDASLANMFMALFAGGTVLLPPSSVLQSLPLFLEYLASSAATVVTLPPTYLRALERAPLAAIRKLISAGEAAPSGEMSHYAAQLAAYNAYGPTEFSVCATMHAVRPDARQAAHSDRTAAAEYQPAYFRCAPAPGPNRNG